MRHIRLTALLLLVACGEDSGTTPPTPTIPVETSITLSATSISFEVLGETSQLTATVNDQNGAAMSSATVTWTSSSTSVATVSSSGLVTSVGDGTATVTATSGSASATAAVTVQVPASIELSDTAVSFASLADTATVPVIVKDASGSTISGATVTWATSDATIATVSDVGLITSVADGTATITATSGEFSATVAVTIEVWESVTTGRDHSCAVTSAGTAYCWGNNGNGQLGDGTTTNSTIPVLVSGEHIWASIDASISVDGGYLHTCGVTTDGAGYCWGSNTYGQLGDGTNTQRLEPVLVTGGLMFTSISAASTHTCGVTTTGQAYCWGWNGIGQLGNGSEEDSNVPVTVSGELTFSSISAKGFSHSCGVTTTGKAYCWGENSLGQLGDSTTINSAVPVAVSGGLIFSSISGGRSYNCGLTSAGIGYCWGNNSYGQLGNGTTTHSPVPVAVSGSHTWGSLSHGGYYHSCGVTKAGVGYCWGYNLSAQLGDATTTDKHIPVIISGGLIFSSITSASSHSCGLTRLRDAYCWGKNSYGQLGDGTTTDSPVPVLVTDPSS
jgi:alpha-tubulin suppressor-like RCC1 family protein